MADEGLLEQICREHGVDFSRNLEMEIDEITASYRAADLGTEHIFNDVEWWKQLAGAKVALDRFAESGVLATASIGPSRITRRRMMSAKRLVSAILDMGEYYGFPSGKRPRARPPNSERDFLLVSLAMAWKRATGHPYKFHDKNLVLRPTPWVLEVAQIVDPALDPDDIIRGLERLGEWSAEDWPSRVQTTEDETDSLDVEFYQPN